MTPQQLQHLRDTGHGWAADEVERLRKDALRYRWLRHGDNDEECIQFSSSAIDGFDQVWLLRNDQLDMVIDAAIAAQEQKE